jgi:hypothetical protein
MYTLQPSKTGFIKPFEAKVKLFAIPGFPQSYCGQISACGSGG